MIHDGYQVYDIKHDDPLAAKLSVAQEKIGVVSFNLSDTTELKDAILTTSLTLTNDEAEAEKLIALFNQVKGKADEFLIALNKLDFKVATATATQATGASRLQDYYIAGSELLLLHSDMTDTPTQVIIATLIASTTTTATLQFDTPSQPLEVGDSLSILKRARFDTDELKVPRDKTQPIDYTLKILE